MKNVLRFKRPKKRVVIFTALLCMAVVLACAANPVKNTKAEAGAQLYGDYVFAKQIYMNPLSSFMAFDGEIPMKSTILGREDGVEDFLSLQQDFKSGYDADRCYNITPKHIEESSAYSLFKYDTSCASFLLYEGKIYPLGEWFGGYGLTSMALADLDGDQKPELYFTYSWGSGLHRSLAAYFDPITKKVVVFNYTHLNKDMLITENNAGKLSLYNATISNLDSFVNFDLERKNFISNILYENGQIFLSPAAI